MQQSKSPWSTLNLPKHYITYCLTFTIYAMSMSNLGPIVPYFTEKTGSKQTEYSFLFLCKSAGFFMGSLLLRKYEQKMIFHSIMIRCSISLFVLMLLFAITYDFLLQGILMVFIGTFMSIMNIVVNVCVAETQKNGDSHFWIMILHGMYGVGGLLGPFVIYLLGIHSYALFGTMLLILAPVYYRLKSPQANQKHLRWIVSTEICQFDGYWQESSKNIRKKAIGRNSQYMLCFLFWAYIGIQLGFGNWISSYAVLQKISSKQEALRYNSIFWIAMTAFRFLSPLISIKSMRKLILHQFSLLAFICISIWLVFQDYASQACLFSSIAFGLCFSSMYPLLLSIPQDYNLIITSTQMTNVALWSALGQAMVSPLFGVLMDWLVHDMLFYGMLAMTVVMIVGTNVLECWYEKDEMVGSWRDISINMGSVELKEVMRTDQGDN